MGTPRHQSMIEGWRKLEYTPGESAFLVLLGAVLPLLRPLHQSCCQNLGLEEQQTPQPRAPPLLSISVRTFEHSAAERHDANSASAVSLGLLKAWAKVLERFLSSDREGAMAALKAARKENRHVEHYLRGRKMKPQSLPDFYSLGDDNEAVHCVANLGSAWERHPAALEWLKTV